jgi:hypothetical protein
VVSTAALSRRVWTSVRVLRVLRVLRGHNSRD